VYKAKEERAGLLAKIPKENKSRCTQQVDLKPSLFFAVVDERAEREMSDPKGRFQQASNPEG